MSNPTRGRPKPVVAALYLALGLLISAFLLTAFAKLVEATFVSKSVMVADRTIVTILHNLISPGLTEVMKGVTLLGSAAFITTALIAAVIVLGSKKHWYEAGLLTVATAGGASLDVVLKEVFRRPRPEIFPPIAVETGFSFPSGHAFGSVAFYGMLAIILVRFVKPQRSKAVIILAAAFLITSIGLSRIYLGVHWPSDVLAGFIAGALWLSLCSNVMEAAHLLRRRKK